MKNLQSHYGDNPKSSLIGGDGGSGRSNGEDKSFEDQEWFFDNANARRIPVSLRLLYPVIEFTIGALMVGLSLDLRNIADNCNVTTSTASWSLVVLGMGVLTSMIFVRYCAPYRYAHDSLPLCLLLFSVTTASLPYITSIVWLYMTAFVIGFIKNVAGTEIYSMIRKLYGRDAGPWCSVIHLSSVLGGVVGNVLSILSYIMSGYTGGDDDDATTCINCSPIYFLVLASAMLSLAMVFLFVRDPERGGYGCGGILCRRRKNNCFRVSFIRKSLLKLTRSCFRKKESFPSNNRWHDDGDEEENDVEEYVYGSTRGRGSTDREYNEHSLLLPASNRSEECNSFHHTDHDNEVIGVRGDIKPPHYHVEIVMAFAMMSVTGCEAVLIAYLTTFAKATDIESYTSAYYQATMAWLCVFLGMFLGMLDQAYQRVNNENLPEKIILRLMIGSVCLFCVTMFSSSEMMLWIATSLFSFMNGPLLGYCFDWLNRITYASELSTGIIMAGSNSGPAMLVVLTLMTWHGAGFGVWAVIYVPGIITFLTIPLIWFSRYLSYRSEINPKLSSTSNISSSIMPTSSSSIHGITSSNRNSNSNSHHPYTMIGQCEYNKSNNNNNNNSSSYEYGDDEDDDEVTSITSTSAVLI